MAPPRVYADFQNLDEANRLRLTCAGTLQELTHHGLQWHDGLVLTFYSDDADEHGQPDELRVAGVVHYDPAGQYWVATIDWGAIRHASEARAKAIKSLVMAPVAKEGEGTSRAVDRPEVRVARVLWRDLAEQSTGADALQPTLRCGFRARLTASVRLQWKDEGWHESDSRRRLCGIAPLGAS